MGKMWAGRSSGITEKIADDFNSSISFDSRMFEEDINGSIAHAKMLTACGIIGQEDGEAICNGLLGILEDLKSGALQIDPEAEDIHMFVEQVLTERIGVAGKKLHTARSRNDQVALDIRLYLRKECAEIDELIRELGKAVTKLAEDHQDLIMPGYTHLQRAQPILFSHHLSAYAFMLERDLGRLRDAVKRMNVSPIGSCALSGTGYPTDRAMEAESLGFDGFCLNSIDGVSDRDFAVEICSVLSMLMMHLSRFSEEIILWSSWEFKFIELSDAFTTGSSIMPQKKNSDMAELVRGKTGRVYGDLMGLLTMLKGLPLAYNKDMQEDKEAIFDAVDTVKMCLKVMAPMVASITPLGDNMLKAAKGGFINATELADYYTSHGMAFRDAYKKVGMLVAECIEKGISLEEAVPPEISKEINLKACIEKRISAGSTGPASVEKEIKYLKGVFI